MSEDTRAVPMDSEEFEAFLPEGWAEGDDIFDVDSWTGVQSQADESEAGDDQEEVTESNEEAEYDTSATGYDEAEGSGSEEYSDANEQYEETPKLRFSAQIDHKVEDVELDEADLPEIYQKAHVTDRVRAKLDKLQPLLDKGNQLAKILGYDTMDAMLDAAAESYRDGEVERLTGEGVHPDVAKELVESRTKRAVEDYSSVNAEDDFDESPGTRDFAAEVADLLSVHPELRGTQLPEEVVNLCVVEGRSLVGAYETHIRRQAEAENRAVRAENKRLKQNADAARRAPVRGVSRGGAPDLEPDDPFLAGFNADLW